MSFRTILISNRCKLDLRMNYMEVRGEKVTKVLLDDLEVLMIENPAVSLTGCLLEALIDKKVKVIFCDHQHNPYSELLPCHGSHDSSRNAALDYGYSLLLSSFNKEIVANGYLTQCGLFHDNIYNPYNLSCDLMEPFRVIVDRKVKKEGFQNFETEEKHEMLRILQEEIIIAETKQYVSNAIKIYTKSVLDALCSENIERLTFYEL